MGRSTMCTATTACAPWVARGTSATPSAACARRSTMRAVRQDVHPHPAAWPGAMVLVLPDALAWSVSRRTRQHGRVQRFHVRVGETPDLFQSSPGARAGCHGDVVARWGGQRSWSPRRHGRRYGAWRPRDPVGPRGAARSRWAAAARGPGGGCRWQDGRGVWCPHPATRRTRVTPSGSSWSAIRMRPA